ncbi:MAG: SDR family oxidoreductase [Bryobacteraceae bacterium]|nr:SDR family oxidoreductase [Bryobacteraceae bacterium]
MSQTTTIRDTGILITGAGRGIGKRLAIGLAQMGARVGLLARSKAELDLAALEIEHAGGTSLRIRADVRDYEQIVAATDRIRAHFGRLDSVICAAAIQGPIGPFATTDPKAWAETIDTNLLGVMHTCRAALPGMLAQKRGKLLLLTGGGGTRPRPNFTAYASAKTALARFAESLAAEVQEHNVQVNCMAPGAAYTSMTDEILRAGDQAGWRELEDAQEVRQSGGIAPEKQLQLAAFLISERSNHISGKLLHASDDWKRLEKDSLTPEAYTLRRSR